MTHNSNTAIGLHSSRSVEEELESIFNFSLTMLHEIVKNAYGVASVVTPLHPNTATGMRFYEEISLWFA
jgi:hypothetical protein